MAEDKVYQRAIDKAHRACHEADEWLKFIGETR